MAATPIELRPFAMRCGYSFGPGTVIGSFSPEF